jgi:Fic family protein
MSEISGRVGGYVRQPSGYRAFIPTPLPPDPPLAIDLPMSALLSRADLALGRLDGVTSTLPDPDLFVAMYVRQEAVYSSQIEGTQSSLDDVLVFELDPGGHEYPADVSDVVNHIRAMNHGLQRLETLPLSLRLIREIHSVLMEGTRGSDRGPGEFRTSQNWIGPGGALLADATFVPPPPAALMEALGEYERFLHQDHGLPSLVHAGMAHSQFETIHPFLDGNGRVGRLLITFQLCQRGILQRPVLHLSSYLKRHRTEYYQRLMAVRDQGDWEGWIAYFLKGVAETAEQATDTARAILALRERHQELVRAQRLERYGLPLLDTLFAQPLVNARSVERTLGVTYATANRLLSLFTDLGVLEETTGARRNRRFRYSPYLALFTQSEEAHSRPTVLADDLA